VIVRVTCPGCSDVAVAVDSVRVARGAGDGAGDTFRFTCPRCGRPVEKKAVGRVADMLLAAGAAEVEVRPLSLEDVDELVRDLEADDWLERLLA
jgi:hypothetical protein